MAIISSHSRLVLNENGIWTALGNEKVSYPEEGNDACFEVEDQSFWFRHRNACIVEMVRNFPPEGRGPIFDVGGVGIPAFCLT
jgi:hypothetical protein